MDGTDHVEEMSEINSAFHDKDLIRILLLKLGICDSGSLDGIVHADDDVIGEFLVDVASSDAMRKLLKYLRS